MKWHRIQAVLLHSYYHAIHSKETWIDLFWFTSIQFIIFGFISQLISGQNASFATGLLMGFFFWETVRIGQYCVTVSILWEVWSHSLSNMFIAPMTMKELMLGQAISGTLKTFLVMIALGTVSSVFFHFSLLVFGPMLIIYGALLLSFAFAAGIFLVGLILRFGTDIQSLAWGMIYILQPISAVFYPVEALPTQVRWIAYISPITYVMESARHQLVTGTVLWNYLGISFVLTLVTMVLATAYLNHMFTWARKTGAFARLGA
jgi:ABC-2 type transport system permease protein